MFWIITRGNKKTVATVFVYAFWYLYYANEIAKNAFCGDKICLCILDDDVKKYGEMDSHMVYSMKNMLKKNRTNH